MAFLLSVIAFNSEGTPGQDWPGLLLYKFRTGLRICVEEYNARASEHYFPLLEDQP